MKICLDTSTLNRPFDDQRQPRIALETQALRTILSLIEAKQVTLVSSTILEYENSRNSAPLRRQWVAQCLQLASEFQPISESITTRAAALEAQGIKSMDALHVASSEEAGCDYFLTCDDRLMRRYAGSLRVVNPVTFILDVTGDEE